MEIYKKRDIPWRIIDDEALVVNPKTSLIYPFNATSSRLWQLIDGARGVEEIIDIIEKEFDKDKQTIQSDTLNFIQQLKEAGLIEKI